MAAVVSCLASSCSGVARFRQCAVCARNATAAAGGSWLGDVVAVVKLIFSVARRCCCTAAPRGADCQCVSRSICNFESVWLRWPCSSGCAPSGERRCTPSLDATCGRSAQVELHLPGSRASTSPCLPAWVCTRLCAFRTRVRTARGERRGTLSVPCACWHLSLVAPRDERHSVHWLASSSQGSGCRH